MSSYITDPDILKLLQDQIDKLEKEQEEGEEASPTSGEDFGLDDLGGTEEETGLFDVDAALGLGGGDELEGEEASTEEPSGEGTEASSPQDTSLPTPASIGLDFTDSNAPEFQ